MENFYNTDKKQTTTQYVLGVGTGLLVLFAVVYVVGKAWKKSQNV
jgi:hypothetical protein